MMGKVFPFLVLGVLLVCVGFALAPGSPFLPGNNVERARATAQAEYLARATPLSDQAIIAVNGMQSVVEVAKEGFRSNVQIAVSADASQTAMAQSIVCAAWAFPAGILGMAALAFALKWGGSKKDSPPVA